MRTFARAGGVFLGDDDVIECDAKDDELVASRRLERVACVARAPSAPACGRGSVLAGSTCAPVVAGGVVDVSRWATAAAVFLCQRLTRVPSIVGAPPVQTFDLEVAVRVPGNDLSEAVIRARTTGAVPGEEIDAVVEELADALRRLPRPHDAPAGATDVLAAAPCQRSSRRPRAEPPQVRAGKTE